MYRATPPEKFPNFIKSHTLSGLYKVVMRVKPDEWQGERRPKYSAVPSIISLTTTIYAWDPLF